MSKLRAAYSMRWLLAFLVLATALPMIFLLAYSVKRESELEIDRAHRLMSAASDAAVADALLFLADQERALSRLAKRPIVREMNSDNCDPSFEVLTMLRPYLANVATADLTGLSVCSVLKPANGVRPRIGDPLWLAEMRRRNAFVTGRPQRGIYTGRWILVLAYPVHDDQGSINGALEFVVNLTAFNAVVAKAVPQGMTGILDQDGTLLASSIDPGQWVGKSMRDLALFKEIQAGQQGWVTSPGADGVERLWAVRPIGSTGWTVVSGIASDSIHAEVERSAWRNGLLGLVILAVSSILVLLISRRITTPLRALRGLESQVAQGRFDQRVPVSGPLEIADRAAGFNAMLDQLQAAEQKLRDSEAHYRTLFDASPDAIRVICNDRVVALNLAGKRMFGVDSPEQLTDMLYGLIDARFHNEVRARFRSVIEERKAVPSMEQVLHRPDGVRIDVEVTSVPFDYRGEPAALSIVRDITRRKLSETALRESESRYARVIEGSDEGFWDWDLRDHSFQVSPRFESMLGYAPGEWQLHPAQWSGQIHPEDRPAVMASLVSHIKGLTDKHEAEMRVRTRSGEWKWVFLRGKAAARDAQGKALIISGTHTDISQRKQAEALIWQQANTDALTGLPNRRMLRDRLDQAIRRCKRDNAKLAVLFIDLDLFKEVNDTLGHDKGDLLLVEAARRIGQGVRESDTVARQGGDEFTASLTELASADCTGQIAQSIVSNLAERFQLGDEEAFISASVGIALYPDDATDIEGLLKSADQALYAAKAAGRNRFSYFTPALQASAQLRMRLTNDLHHALAGQQLEVFYQPIVDLATGAIHKAEALLRWQHPVRGRVNPAEFIPLAEASGLIIDIGDWVFRQAAQQVKHWRARYHPDFQLSVNTSPVQFADGGPLQAAWPGHLASLGLPGQSLVVEITEGMLLASRTEVMAQLEALRSAGIGVSLDDFGTGYSSLSYLQKYAIDYVKIDQSFVRNLVAGGKDLALCKAIIVMAHELGMQVVAEGIETPEQRTLLAAAGCDHGQGYLFARPLPVDEFEALLAAQIV